MLWCCVLQEKILWTHARRQQKLSCVCHFICWLSEKGCVRLKKRVSFIFSMSCIICQLIRLSLNRERLSKKSISISLILHIVYILQHKEDFHWIHWCVDLDGHVYSELFLLFTLFLVVLQFTLFWLNATFMLVLNVDSGLSLVLCCAMLFCQYSDSCN